MAKDFSEILRPDGKLLPEEQAHHKTLGLCSYCGEDHGGEKCPIKPSKEVFSSDKPSTLSNPLSNSPSSPKPKGHVVQVADPVVEDSDSRDTVDLDC